MTGTITVAKDSSRSGLTCGAPASEPSGSSAGPPAAHHAWVQANTSSGADATVEMSCAACPGGAQQPDRGPELRTVSVPVDPPVPRVHGPVIMNARRGEQRRVDRVIGVMVAEHHVRYVRGLWSLIGQRGQQGRPGGHHAGVDDDDRGPVDDQRDGPRHPFVVTVPADIALM